MLEFGFWSLKGPPSQDLTPLLGADSPDLGSGFAEPPGDGEFLPDFGSADPPDMAQDTKDGYTTYQSVAPALAVPNSYFTVDTSTDALAPGYYQQLAPGAGIKSIITDNTEVASASPGISRLPCP